MTISNLSFVQLFKLLLLFFAGLFAASVLSAWTGPTTAPPDGNVSAPINVGTTDQVKNAGLSVNAMTVFGSQYIQDKLGVNKANPVVALQVVGTMIVGDGGEVCQAVTEGAIRYNSTSNALEYCNGTAWTGTGGSGISKTVIATCVASNYGSCSVSCPATYVRTGCNHSDTITTSWPSGSGCTCGAAGATSRTCYAICSKVTLHHALSP